MNEWQKRLRHDLPRDRIPTFLVELQRLVEALREDQPWQLGPALLEHPQLVLDYLQPGSTRDEVAAAFYSDAAKPGQREHGE